MVHVDLGDCGRMALLGLYHGTEAALIVEAAIHDIRILPTDIFDQESEREARAQASRRSR